MTFLDAARPGVMQPILLSRTAVHEAGHAVIARVVGLFCGEVSIIPDRPDEVGFSVIEDPRFGWRRGDGPRVKSAENFCISLYAGAEAERFFFGSAIMVHDGEDQRRALGALLWSGVKNGGMFGNEAWKRKEASLRRKSRQLVLRHASTIQRVAESLLIKKTLTGDEVADLMK